MVDKKTLTRRSALGLIAAGGLYHATGTFAFDRLDSGRSTSMTTGDDERAFVALVEAEYDEIPNNDFEAIASLTNNLSDDVSVVGYAISTNQDGVSVRFNGEAGEPGETLTGDVTIAEAASEPIELECSTPGQISGDEILTVEFTQAQTQEGDVSIEDVEMDMEFLCTGAVLHIEDVRGLVDSRPFQELEAEIDVAETANEETENLTVELTIVGDSGGDVYNATRQTPDDIDEIQNETTTVEFDDIGTLDEDDYEYTVVVDADNANPRTETGRFVVDGDLLIIDLVADRGAARDLGIDAINRSGETLELVAIAAEHDPDGDTSNRDREEFEQLRIDIGGDGNEEIVEGGRNDELPGDGTRIDHEPVDILDGQDAEYTLERWDGGGNIAGEEFEITIWARDEDGLEDATVDRVQVP